MMGYRFNLKRKNMTPKEKAKELIDEITHVIVSTLELHMVSLEDEIVKKLALMVVDERMKPEPLNGNVLARKYFLYWNEVKREIESF